MCYSASASIGSFCVSLVGASYLFLRNQGADRVFATVVFGVSIMQLGEYMMHIDENCLTGWNRYGSILGLLSHSLIQPLFSLGAVLLFSTAPLAPLVLMGWVAILLANAIYSWINWPTPKQLCSVKHKCASRDVCQLTWPWYSSVNVPMYALLVFVLPIVFSNIKHKLWWLLYAGAGPLFLNLLYSKTASSLWCFWGPALTILLKVMF